MSKKIDKTEQKKEQNITVLFLVQATNGSRTRDLYITNVALYHLSYSSIYDVELVNC